MSRFLDEIFSVTVKRGKVEIESSELIMGTAVTMNRGEISALPMLPSPVAYDFHSDDGNEVDLAEVVLWAEGVFVKGYLCFLQVDGQPLVQPENCLVSG